jgi:hypothetical protein
MVDMGITPTHTGLTTAIAPVKVVTTTVIGIPRKDTDTVTPMAETITVWTTDHGVITTVMLNHEFTFGSNSK